MNEPNQAQPPRLLARVRQAIRARHYSPRTERAYVGWIRRYVQHHGCRHPLEMGEAEVTAFLSHLATHRRVSASTQNQALSALLFLYRVVLERDLPWLEGLVRAKRPIRLPVVLTREEVRALLRELDGTPRIVGSLLYGAGLRLLEAMRLRVKDVDFARNEITVRDGKGRKDRVTLLPEAAREPLQRHLVAVRAQHRRDLARGLGRVAMPDALGAKYPSAAREWGWQWVFPATSHYVDTETRERRRPPPQLRDPPAGSQLRHPHHPGIARSLRRLHDDDLHPRPEPPGPGRAQPARHRY